jgi:hypothetical protein
MSMTGWVRAGLRVWLAAFLGVGVLLPLAAVLREGWGFAGFLSLAPLAVRTFAQASLSAALAGAVGLLAALSIGREARPGLVWAFPYSVPTVAAASVAVTWLGRAGWLARRRVRNFRRGAGHALP